VYVHFALDRKIPKDNITITLTVTLGSRTDTLTIARANQADVLWEIFSDKYFAETSFSCSAQVEVSGPNFTDNPVTWQDAAPIVVAVPAGRVKYINPCIITLPPVPAAQLETVNQYIAAYPAPAPGT
jgi:hypothetical protein